MFTSQSHQCPGQIKEKELKLEKQFKVQGTHLWSKQVEIKKERKQFVLITADEYFTIITHCPYCGKKLE